MSLSRLLLCSLWRFRRTNLGVLLGAAVTTTVITGALIIGDSMRHTLQAIADQRLGTVSHAVIGGDRFFTDRLVDTLNDDNANLIMLNGVVSTPDDRVRVNEVAVTGIDDAFAPLLGGPTTPKPGEAVLNNALRDRLDAKPGDTLILRVQEPSALPIDAALVNASEPAMALRLTVASTIDDALGGRYSLKAEQRTPMNLFVNRRWLADQLGTPGKSNAALFNTYPGKVHPAFDDIGLVLKPAADGRNELTTPRVLIDRSTTYGLSKLPGTRLLTYLVNTIAINERQSPYAMVCAADGLGGLKLGADEIAINRWLAEDLKAGAGDTLTLTYYVPDAGDRLVEAQAKLRVAKVVEIQGAFADRTLTPDFPGLAEADTLRSWDAGPAIDRSRIRDKDEAYWDEYRATPKAFINLATGQKLWANRFGTLTAIRFDAPVNEAHLLERIDTQAIGFVPIAIRTQAQQAAAGTVDFGQLFLSLSAFIIIAAVVLTATLFAMSAEQRARQLGTLFALGFTRRQVLTLTLSEGVILAGLGAALGVAGGLAYASGVINTLSGVWSGAVAGVPVQLHASPVSLTAGPIGALAISTAAIWLAVRGLARRPARELLSGALGKVSGKPIVSPAFGLLGAIGWLSAAGTQAFHASDRTGMDAGIKGFTAGGFLLCGLMMCIYALMTRRRIKPASRMGMSLPRLSLRNLSRRRSRTLAAIVTLACGVFLVLAVSGFRLSASDDPTDPASGTGGFSLIVETTQPIRYDLNTKLGRDHYALSEDDLSPGSIVPFKVGGGDDASCLNLNKTQAPRILGVDSDLLNERDAFTFQGNSEYAPDWSSLRQDSYFCREYPAIADANTAQWALKLAVGDRLEMTDAQGRSMRIRLVGTIENSILQGSLIIDETAFAQAYPEVSGDRLLLVDVGGDDAARQNTAALLEEVLIDEGAMITPAQQRLSEYNRVQNTYLAIFQALGGLGVVLGTLGLGVIASRNILERRAELALMTALGLSRSRVIRLLIMEHSLLLAVGLVLGFAAAAIPASGNGVFMGGAWQLSAFTIAAIGLVGLIAVGLGVISAISGRLTDTLRGE